MKDARSWRQSPALIVSILALAAAVTGAAVASPNAQTAKAPLTIKKVRSIANAQIAKKAPGLSVAHATSANTATSANPVMFAHVNGDGTVVPADSKGVTNANVTHVATTGTYCFHGLPGGIKGGQAIVDWNDDGAVADAQFALGDGACNPGDQGSVETTNGTSAGGVDKAFFVVFYR